MKGGSGDQYQPKISMQAPGRRMPAPQPSAFQQTLTDQQLTPQQQQSSLGTPGPNLQAQAEPFDEARNLDTPETEPPNEISDDMVIVNILTPSSLILTARQWNVCDKPKTVWYSRGMTNLTCMLQGTLMTVTPPAPTSV